MKSFHIHATSSSIHVCSLLTLFGLPLLFHFFVDYIGTSTNAQTHAQIQLKNEGTKTETVEVGLLAPRFRKYDVMS